MKQKWDCKYTKYEAKIGLHLYEIQTGLRLHHKKQFLSSGACSQSETFGPEKKLAHRSGIPHCRGMPHHFSFLWSLYRDPSKGEMQGVTDHNSLLTILLVVISGSQED